MMYTLPQSRGACRRQAGTCYCGCSRSRLGYIHSVNRTERPGHRAHSGGSRDRTAPRMERYLRPQHHVQKLLDPMDIPLCEERHTECHWESVDGQAILSRSRVNDVLTELHSGPSGGHVCVNKTVNMVRQKYSWLQARNVE
jgi:hypothetical protein